MSRLRALADDAERPVHHPSVDGHDLVTAIRRGEQGRRGSRRSRTLAHPQQDLVPGDGVQPEVEDGLGLQAQLIVVHHGAYLVAHRFVSFLGCTRPHRPAHPARPTRIVNQISPGHWLPAGERHRAEAGAEP
nr:hypothetical protein [Actinoplanes sp. N902-109]